MLDNCIMAGGKLWRIIFCLLTKMVCVQWCTNLWSIIWKAVLLIMMHRLSVASIIWGYHEYKYVWSEGSGKFCFYFRGQKNFRLCTSGLYSYTCQIFIWKLRVLQKNGDKFGWVKYWQMTFHSPNSLKFSTATILCYTVHMNK